MDFLKIILEVIFKNVFNWCITGVITFFSVKLATQKYYGKVRVILTRTILEQGLRALLKLGYNEMLPTNSAAIFVEYKGRCHKLKFKRRNNEECIWGDKIRKTITYAGGESMHISWKKLRNYGVLGVANTLKVPVIYDFRSNKLFKYEFNEFIQLDVIFEETPNRVKRFYYVDENECKMEITAGVSGRDIMIAYPIILDDNLVGGITFDMRVAENTIYKKIEETDTPEQVVEKKEANIEVMTVVKRTVDNVINSYFNKKGMD